VTILKGKGGKPRVVPIGQYATYYLQRYLDKGRKYMLKGKREDPGFLFLSQRGHPFNKTTINKCVMHPVARKLGTKKYLSCYTMRHSVATHLLANHVDIAHRPASGTRLLEDDPAVCHVEIGDLKRYIANSTRGSRVQRDLA
jgi:site-specific recombinase XerD